MKSYGKNKLSYVVIEKMNGRIELQVHHHNRSFREILRQNTGNSRYFLEHRDTYRRGHKRAQHWLAQVIDDYRSYFIANQVDITFH